MAEINKQKSKKQEAKEPAPCAEPVVVEANSLQGGDKPQKRPEKRRQSLGGFFKGLVGGPFTSPSWALGPGVWFPLRKGTNYLGTGGHLSNNIYGVPAVCQALCQAQRARSTWAMLSGADGQVQDGGVGTARRQKAGM